MPWARIIRCAIEEGAVLRLVQRVAARTIGLLRQRMSGLSCSHRMVSQIADVGVRRYCLANLRRRQGGA